MSELFFAGLFHCKKSEWRKPGPEGRAQNIYNGHLFDRTFIEYDNADVSLPTTFGSNPLYYKQSYTAAKVSKTWNDRTTTWYSYDEQGRQAWTVQHSNELGYKTMRYIYDFRGKLLASGYQVLESDNLIHNYSYDADERLSTALYGVYTATNAVNFMKPLGAYAYYLHGPLKRSVLGNQLQGLDYVYTVDGKLKAVNNPVNSATGSDPGLDGYSTGPHAGVSPDAFGYALEYYPDDYARSGSPIRSYTNANAYANNLSYTGLVKAQSWRTVLPAAATNSYSTGLMYEYQYDELYRLRGATFGTITETAPTVGNPQWSNTFTQKPEYKLENIDYDKNGNLQHLKRYAAPINSTTAHLLDNLTYNYDSSKKNKLKQVGDAASNTAGYSADLDLPNQSNSSNYVYNSIGELVENKQEGRGYEYNAAGLVTRVFELSTNNPLTEYTYNDKGLKYSKTSYSGGLFSVETEQLFYVYDAGGAEVATYKKLVQVPNDVYALQHHTLYGAGRVGLLDKSTGKALFELSDHLGNVRAVVADNGSGVAETVSYTDYYPHGGVLPGRNYQSSLNFPYGYQGQEKDAATGLTNFELRQYDPRIGRWYNPDPMGQHHSPYLAMSNNPVSFTDVDGGWDSGGADDGFRQAVESSNNWMRMTPADRRAYQAANGTDYAGQFRDKVFDLAFVGGYEDQDGNNWYYSARKNDIGAWMKMYDSNPFGYYRTASGDGQFKAGASWLNVSERFVGLGYNGEVERMKWAQKTYGGTGDGSILDQLHQSFSDFNTKYNPIAHLVNGIDGIVFGTDRFGNQQSGIQTATQLTSGIVGIFGGSIANGIASRVVGEGMPTATKLSELGIKELQELTRIYSTEMNAFFKSGGTQVASKEGLQAYRELATRLLNNTGGAYQRVTDVAARLHTQRIELIDQALKSLK